MNWLFGEPTTVDQRAEFRSVDGPTFSVGDPALAEYLGLSGQTSAGVTVTESNAIGLTAVYRSVALIAGTVAGLPLKTYRTLPDGTRERVASFLDNPGGALYTPFEWAELALTHLLLHGNAYLLHAYNGAGAVEFLQPVHPSAVTVEAADVPGGKLFKVSMADGTTREYTSADLTHVPGLGTDGLAGLSPISFARQSLGTAIAGDQAAARMFSNGMMLGGLVSSEDGSLTEDDAKLVLAGLKAKLTGTKNAGDIAMVNAGLKFTPWTVPAKDAQFLESRQFGVSEAARLYGLPVQMLAQDGASSWGSGIQELVRGFQRFTLTSWTQRIEQRLSRLLPDSRFCEFDYAGLLEGSPAEVTQNLAAEIDAGLLTVDEARRILNRPPLSATPTDSPAPGTE